MGEISATASTEDLPLPDTWSDQLCSKCMAIAFGRKSLKFLLSSNGYRHHKISDLISSHLSGCRLCSLIQHQLMRDDYFFASFTPQGDEMQNEMADSNYIYISAYNPELAIAVMTDKFALGWGPREGPPQYEMGSGNDKFYPSLSVFMEDQAIGDFKFSSIESKPPHLYRTHILIVIDRPDITYPKRLPTSFPVTSPQVKAEIQNLRNICSMKHGTTCVPENPSILPPRVIDVESPTSPTRLSLHHSSPLELGYYACLSYCWGVSSHSFMTTKKSLHNPELLDWSQPPATISDAITVTRSLGLRYLWIDALCIVQDDEADKIRQIKSMTSIYKNATIVIAAASSSSVEKGFLGERSVPNFSLPVISDGHEIVKLHIYAAYDGHIEKEPLDKRGWALQEFLLAPRLLYYGSADLIWKCLGISCQSVTGNQNHYEEFLFPSLTPEVLEIGGGKVAPFEHYKMWRFIQSSYSERLLQREEDRYRAIGAVAEAIQKVSTDQYIAGLWRDDIIEGLTWRSDFRGSEGEEEEERNQIPPSPSWSWLARLRPTYCTGVSADHIDPATLVSWSLDMADDGSPFGHIQGGSLKMLATVVRSNDIPRDGIFGQPRSIFQCHLDIPSRNHIIEDYYRYFVGDQYLYLRLGWSIGWDSDSRHSVWLLLESLNGGVYVRRGLVSFREQENEIPDWQKNFGERKTIEIV